MMVSEYERVMRQLESKHAVLLKFDGSEPRFLEGPYKGMTLDEGVKAEIEKRRAEFDKLVAEEMVNNGAYSA